MWFRVREHVFKLERHRLNVDGSDLNDDNLQAFIGLKTFDFDNLAEYKTEILKKSNYFN